MKSHAVNAGSPPTRPSLLIRLRGLDDQLAWNQFVDIYTPLVYRHCRSRGLRDADAADVSQEVMRAITGAIQRFEYDPQRGRFRTWLLTVTRSKLNNFFASQHRHPQGTGDTSVQRFLEEQPAPVEEAAWDCEYERQLFQWAAAAVRPEFKDSTWQAFWLTAVEEQSGQEVAQSLGLSVGAVYIARSRVLARLREKIASVAGEGPQWPGESTPTAPGSP